RLSFGRLPRIESDYAAQRVSGRGKKNSGSTGCLVACQRNLSLCEKRIGFALLANGGQRSVSRYNDSLIGQAQQLSVEGLDDLVERSARKIGPANAPGKKSIPGDQLMFTRKVKADAALGVSWRVQ